MALFESTAQGVVAETISQAKRQERDLIRADFDLAVRYADGDMLDDVQSEIQTRYGASQSSGRPAGIQAVTLPLVEHYLDEMATAYTAGVQRELVAEDGSVDEDETKALNDHLGEIGFDQQRNQLERYAILLKSCGIYYQDNEDGALDPVIYLPQDIYPVEEDSDTADPGRVFNPINPDTYKGFILASRTGDSDVTQPTNDRYAFVNNQKIAQFTGKGPGEIGMMIGEADNPYDKLMLSIWHTRRPARQLIPDGTPSILAANRELNILWSVVLDIIRFQGGALLSRSVTNPDDIEAARPVGVRFPLVQAMEENSTYLNASNDYAGIGAILQDFVNLVTLLHRMGAGSVALESKQISSGFAKVLDNLPKTEARNERIEWLSIVEQRDWLKYRLPLIANKILTERSNGLKLRIEYGEHETPRPLDEMIKDFEFQLRHGQTSPIELMVKERGISEDEARDEIAKNKAESSGGVSRLLSNDPAARNGEVARLIGARGDDGDREPVARIAQPEPPEPAGPAVAAATRAATEPATEDAVPPDTALNGAQVSSLMDIVQSVAGGEIPRATGVELMVAAFPFDKLQAEKIMGDVGRGFTPKVDDAEPD